MWSGEASSHEEVIEDRRCNLRREVFYQCFCEALRLIPSAPAFSSRVERDGQYGIRQGEIRPKECGCKECAERDAQIVNESVFEKVDEVCDARIVIVKRGKNAVMRGNALA